MSRPNQSADTRVYAVQGMSCRHCVDSVHKEVLAVPAVCAVDVDLASGRLTVSGEGVDDGAVRAAVADAGFGVAA